IGKLTLRAVARKAGVSHNAPYNHFADKAALVEALVAEGFARFVVELRAAYDQTPGLPLDKVVALGVAYVRFALLHPPLFRLMFRPELRSSQRESDEPPPAVDTASDTQPYGEGFQILLDGLAAAQEAGQLAGGNGLLLALSAWSIDHGLALLILDGAAGQLAASPQAGAHLAEQVMTVLRYGLQVRTSAQQREGGGLPLVCCPRQLPLSWREWTRVCKRERRGRPLNIARAG